ncbi:MAG: hypothetical protein EBZ69_06000 [Alphaproteobacteria bacterium]|nr:hypothetical protein [Alphaproteobacteria bacterium]
MIPSAKSPNKHDARRPKPPFGASDHVLLLLHVSMLMESFSASGKGVLFAKVNQQRGLAKIDPCGEPPTPVLAPTHTRKICP